ncbi:MAG: DUF6111 family protein [Hyphomicrobiales bacterium]|nr:DUF6111 family protein [Hyphomicrobiales bacterium]
MARVFLISLALLVLPFILYAGYAKFARRGEESGQIWRDAPIVWLGVTGVILAVAGLIGLVQLTGM